MHLGNFVIRILIALLLGTAIGVERQWHQRTAGLRTNALVSVGSALFASLACLMANESSPTRMAAQIVSGIGFLGAGLILREGNHVRGLTTAATVWCSAAVGTLCGSGFFAHAVVGSVAVLVANIILRPFSLRIAAIAPDDLSELETTYLLKLTCSQATEQRARALLMNSVLRTSSMLRSLHSEASKDSDLVKVTAQVITAGKQDQIMETIVNELGIDDKINSVSWEVQSLDSGKE